MSWSGGGPAGYRLAVCHPDRVAALAAFAALSEAYHVPETDLTTRLMFTTGLGRWLLRLLATHQPEQYIAGLLSGEGSLTNEQLTQRVEEVFADPVKRDFVLALGPTASQDKTRRTGYLNDLDQFAAITSLELGKITAPTLVIQGSADSDVSPAHSTFAAETIPGAELLTLDTGTHLALYTHPEAASTQSRVVDTPSGLVVVAVSQDWAGSGPVAGLAAAPRRALVLDFEYAQGVLAAGGPKDRLDSRELRARHHARHMSRQAQ